MMRRKKSAQGAGLSPDTEAWLSSLKPISVNSSYHQATEEKLQGPKSDTRERLTESQLIHEENPQRSGAEVHPPTEIALAQTTET